MTTIFLEINNDSSLLEHLTYNSETKVFTELTERVGDWEKVNVKCPKESEHYSFIESLYFNRPPGNIMSINKIFEKKFMTYELNPNCIWQHPTTGNHLEVTKIVWGEVEKPIIITVKSLRQAQPGTWRVPIKQDTEDLINPLSSLVDFTKFPIFAQAHPLQKHLVKEHILYCQSLTHDSGQCS